LLNDSNATNNEFVNLQPADSSPAHEEPTDSQGPDGQGTEGCGANHDGAHCGCTDGVRARCGRRQGTCGL
jgi:hypothetical protein